MREDLTLRYSFKCNLDFFRWIKPGGLVAGHKHDTYKQEDAIGLTGRLPVGYGTKSKAK